MDTGYERRLLARARELADPSDPRAETLTCLGAARHAGLDPDALSGLVGCAAALGASSIGTYTAGTAWAGRHGDERHFLGHVSAIEDDLKERLHAATRLARQATEALDDARDGLDGARKRLAAAHAMPARRPCDGCHDARRAAIAAAEAAITEAQEAIRECETRISISEETIRILTDLVRRLRWALTRLRAVPADLGETYESVYNLIRHGGALPRDGRWITGTAS
jgi:hypothetical protein